jgi:hypothetical protein
MGQAGVVADSWILRYAGNERSCMILHDLFDWSNAGVGVAGLALTIGAIWQATGAKKAAREARQAVFHKNSAEDLGSIRDLAFDLLSALLTERYELALHIAGRCISACSTARERHRGFLGTEGGKLELAVDLVATVSQKMQPGADRTNLIADAQRVVRLLSSVKGVLDRDLEEEEQ